MARKSTGKRQRFNIFKRDKFTCQYCGRTPPAIVLVLDHILPVSKGGETIDHNLITSCETCNQGKADGLLGDVPQAIDANLAAQVERREQLEAFNKYLMKGRLKDEKTAKEIGTYWNDCLKPVEEKGRWTFGTARLPSVRKFVAALPVTEIYDAVDIALRNIQATDKDSDQAFKYFCGICWKKIKERAEPGDPHG